MKIQFIEFHRSLTALPLLLAIPAFVGMAQAATIDFGFTGADGDPGVAGGDGGAASASASASFPGNQAEAYGGQGGTGGTGADGGDGGRATAMATTNPPFSPTTQASEALAVAMGGQGGSSGQGPATGGDGGRADANASGRASGANAVRADARAEGGNGGDSFADQSLGFSGGSGGEALATASGISDTGDVTLYSTSRGGGGGTGYEVAGGGGGASVTVYNSLSGQTSGRLVGVQEVIGGTGGIGNLNGGTSGVGGDGGQAVSELFLLTEPSLLVDFLTLATGGEGGHSDGDFGGQAGEARASTTLHDNGSATAWGRSVARGGIGGASGFGIDGTEGGSATAQSFVSMTADGRVFSTAQATGGTGGDAHGSGAKGGMGGEASADARFSSNGASNGIVINTVKGGAGGTGILGADGGDGRNAQGFVTADSTATKTTGTVGASVIVTGGRGGDSDGGTAGAGGMARGDARLGVSPATYVSLQSSATGGDGGNAFNGGTAGTAGDAIADVGGTDTGATEVGARAIARGGAGGSTDLGDGQAGGLATAGGDLEADGPVTFETEATGGTGGTGSGAGHRGGDGGTATGTASGVSTGGGNVFVSLAQRGGDGGAGINGADGGNGADAITDGSRVLGGTDGSLTLRHSAQGGAGGRAMDGGSGGRGGEAVSRLEVTDTQASQIDVGLSALGGGGGAAGLGQSGNGGRADADLAVNSSANAGFATARAEGGLPGSEFGGVRGSTGWARAASALTMTDPGASFASARSEAQSGVAYDPVTGAVSGTAFDGSAFATAEAVGATANLAAASATSHGVDRATGGDTVVVTAGIMAQGAGGSRAKATAFAADFGDRGFYAQNVKAADEQYNEIVINDVASARTATFSAAFAPASTPISLFNGSFALSYTGSGESLTYTASSSAQFSGVTGDLYADFGPFGAGLFDSLALSVKLNGTSVIDEMFANLAAFEAAFSTSRLLGTLTGGVDKVSLSFVMTASTIGAGLGMTYGAFTEDTSPPVAPIPVPAALPLLATALAGLGLARLKRRRKSIVA